MNYYERVCIAFDRDMKKALDEVVFAEKTNRSHLLRKLFNEYYKSYKSKVLIND